MYIDTHCHIFEKYYNNIDQVIIESINNEVKNLIISCCEKQDIKETLNILKKYDCIYATVGFHPDQIKNINSSDLNILEEIINENNKVVGIGEIGLDYHYSKDKQLQKDLFEKQLKLAEKLNLPVVIHTRDATNDTIEILKKYKVKGIIHCFSGSLETANIYIKMGFKLGIGGVVTFRNSNLKEVIKNINISDIVLETDSPYLTPEPFRGKTNSPKYIPVIAAEIANLKGIPVNELATNILQNTIEIFDLKL